MTWNDNVILHHLSYFSTISWNGCIITRVNIQTDVLLSKWLYSSPQVKMLSIFQCEVSLQVKLWLGEMQTLHWSLHPLHRPLHHFSLFVLFPSLVPFNLLHLFSLCAFFIICIPAWNLEPFVSFSPIAWVFTPLVLTFALFVLSHPLDQPSLPLHQSHPFCLLTFCTSLCIPCTSLKPFTPFYPLCQHLHPFHPCVLVLPFTPPCTNLCIPFTFSTIRPLHKPLHLKYTLYQ